MIWLFIGVILLIIIIAFSTSKNFSTREDLQEAEIKKVEKKEPFVIICDEEIQTPARKRKPEDKLFSLVGVHIASRKDYIVDNCNVGDLISLIDEPDNKHDGGAIKVIHHKKKIGYVSQSHQVLVRRLLKKGFIPRLQFVNYSDDYLIVNYKFEID